MDSNLEPAKNEYFQKKEEKEQLKKEMQKSRTMKTIVRWGVLILVFAVILWYIFGHFKTASDNWKEIEAMEQIYPAQSRDHIEPGKQHPAYNSNPPTGGWHYAVPAQTGIYDKELPDEQLIHNLEHGHVWIAYKPDLASDQIELLADIAKSYGSKIVMTPRAANDSPIALVVWEKVIKMNAVDDNIVKAFIEKYRGTAGPEKNIPDFGFDDFRGKNVSPSDLPSMQQPK